MALLKSSMIEKLLSNTNIKYKKITLQVKLNRKTDFTQYNICQANRWIFLSHVDTN